MDENNSYTKLAKPETIDKTKKSLEEKGYSVFVVEKGSEALDKIKDLIPNGSTVINGSSITLEKIGYPEFLQGGQSGWIDLHAKVNAENDPGKRSKLRREATVSDFYLGSVHALTETGDFIIASNTGSQLPSIVFNSANLIFVVGTQKIVPDLATAMNRLEEYILPLEDKHLMDKYGAHTNISKVLIFKKEPAYLGRKVNIILIKEKLGF